jgi:hypothetical protein
MTRPFIGDLSLCLNFFPAFRVSQIVFGLSFYLCGSQSNDCGNDKVVHDDLQCFSGGAWNSCRLEVYAISAGFWSCPFLFTQTLMRF